MALNELERKLIAAARTKAADERVPYAFEKRVLARVKELPAVDLAALWSRALWRAAGPCLAIMLVLGLWVALAPQTNISKSDFSQDFENTVLAVVNQEPTAEIAW